MLSVSIGNSKRLLYQLHPAMLHYKSLNSAGAPNSSVASDSAPSAKEYSGNKSFVAGLAFVLLSAFGIRYAHNSPEIRDTLTLHLPWLDDFIAIIYQENMSYREYLRKVIKDNLDIDKYITLKNAAIQDRRLRDIQKCEVSDIVGKKDA